MEAVKVEDIEIDRCKGCGGLWFDLLEHEHLKAITGSEKVDSGDQNRGREQDLVRKVDCPRCQTAMIGMVFAQQGHIRYEMCSVCSGVYLDAGEFADFKDLTLGERMKHAWGLFKKP
jgi:Zn-finger nucleic acid-binding protein